MSIEIEELLEYWNNAKKEIIVLEKKCDNYKKMVEKMMISQQTDKLDSKNFSVSKKILSRDILTKNDVPCDVWYQYSRKVSYPAYYLKEKSKKKLLKRSRSSKKSM